MSEKKINAPKAGERAKGVKLSSITNQAQLQCHDPLSMTRRDTSAAATTFIRISVETNIGRTLQSLIAAGEKGITQIDVAEWTYRLPAHIYTLRQNYGLIFSKARFQNGGSWQRYILRTKVIIIGTISSE